MKKFSEALKRVFLYCALFSMLALAEKRFGIFGLSLAFCLALLFCGENVLKSLIPYGFCTSLIHFSLSVLLVVACGVVAVLLLAVIRYRTDKKYRIWAIELAFAVAQIPIFFINALTNEYVTRQALGVVVGMAFCYVCISCCYPFLVRGVRYKISPSELASGVIFLIAICCGISYVDILGVRIVYLISTVTVFIFGAIARSKILPFCAIMGWSAGMVTGRMEEFFFLFLIGLIVYSLYHKNKFFCSAVVLGTFIGLQYLISRTFDLKAIIPLSVACLTVFIPNKYVERLEGERESYQGKFALRTILNRDRTEVKQKLNSVAIALKRMEILLTGEENNEIKPSLIVTRLKETCCHVCPRFAHCKEKLGDVTPLLTKFVKTAFDNGRASMLDADEMPSFCIKVPKMVNLVNECVNNYKRLREKKSGVEIGKEMIIGNLGGTADLLKELATTIDDGFVFDVKTEEKLIEELGYANVIASDVAIYGTGKVTLSVREKDMKKPQIKEVLSSVVGEKMRETAIQKGVNGVVTLTFRPSPDYGVLYGEKSQGKEDSCGDCTKVIRIDDYRLMFVLSDGMGVGESAQKVGLDTLRLIEHFYKAGFSHKAIFTSISRMLALRTKENFSALDIVIVDTQKGNIDFIKQGGRESYLFTQEGNTEVIEGGTLPLGIIEECQPSIVEKKLNNGDLIVMFSDGIADRLSYADVKEIVNKSSTTNPQIIADDIFNNAQKKCDDRQDDMTVIALRVVKNAR